MHSLSDSLFLNTLAKKKVTRTPVWFMRQAGRYLPEYRVTRQKAGDFLTLCKTPDLACEVTLQPLRRYTLDAAILFSDILTIPDAMGLGLHFVEGEGPCFTNPLSTDQDIFNLPQSAIIDNLTYVMDAASLIRRTMPTHLPLIGFSGSPWTLACYMIEGRSTREFKKILRWMYMAPNSLHFLLKLLADIVADYLIAQVGAGVNALMIFDTWGGILTTEQYKSCSLMYMQQIITKIKQACTVPIIIFTKGGGQWLEAQAETGCDALSLDWTTDLSLARARVGAKVSLQGNLDPSVLLTTPDVVYQEVLKTLVAYGQGSGHVFNLGHGITPDVPVENVAAMIEAIHQYSPQYHSV